MEGFAGSWIVGNDGCGLAEFVSKKNVPALHWNGCRSVLSATTIEISQKGIKEILLHLIVSFLSLFVPFSSWVWIIGLHSVNCIMELGVLCKE